jgi:transposase
MLAFVDLEERVPVDHPLRAIKRLADEALAELSPALDAMYREGGRPSIPPERLLKATLLIALYSVRSERAFCEELDYHLLFRWFLDMNLIEPSFDASTFAKNRGRLLEHAVGQRLFDTVVAQAQEQDLLSDEHFTVDGTLIEACASLKSFRRRDEDGPPPPEDPGNPSVDFHGEQRSNRTHQSTTDPEARLMRQELRYGRVRGGPARARGHAARGPEHRPQGRQRDRRADDAPPRLRGKSADSQAGGRDLRLDEDGGRLPAHALSRAGGDPPRGLLRGDRLQFGALESAGGARPSTPGSGLA